MLYRHEAVRAAYWTIAGLGGLSLVIPMLGQLLGTSRPAALGVLALGGLGAATLVFGAIALGVVVPRRRFSDDAELARWVGTRERAVAYLRTASGSAAREADASFASDLLSSVELSASADRPGAPSRALIDALLDATAARIAKINPAALPGRDEVQRARRYMLIALLLNVLSLVLIPAVVRSGWHSLLFSPKQPFDGAKLSEVPLVGDLEATLTFPAYAKRAPLPLPSSSGDLRGLPGTIVDLRARVLVPAASVDLIIDGATTPIPTKLDGDVITARLKIDKTATYRFAVLAPTGGRAIETTPRTIEAEPDQAPAVQLMAPADTLDVTNLRRVELAYVIEDDYATVSAELVWESGKDRGKKPIQITPGARAQGKVLWDIAELTVPSGGEVRYWMEAKDNDDVRGPNIGKSRELRLKVVSPRERHEETLGRHQELAEKFVRNLGTRLVPPPDDAQKEAVRSEVAAKLREAVVELGSLSAAYDKDPHASESLRKSLGTMRDRLDKLVQQEHKLLPTKPGVKMLVNRFNVLDPRMIGELEDDVIALADWLDRERMEGLLDITDEISAHQKRLSDLMAQYEKTKDPRLLDEIEREMKALERAYAELEKHKRGMTEDVLDQYVHREAVDTKRGASCLEEVRALVRGGQVAKAKEKLDACRAQHDRSAQSLEGSLADLRGDKFSDEQRKLDEVMNELADVARDQEDIAEESNRIFEQYARKADEVAKDNRREASKKVGALVDKLRRRIAEIESSGLTPFAKEELDIVERRISDVEHMVADGDLAEALGMARQAQTSIDTIASELEAAINDDPKSKWADATQEALDGVERAQPVAKELIKELQGLSPKPDQIMSADDLRALDRLRRRQAMNKGRTAKLQERTKQLGAELPGDAGEKLGKKLGGAIEHMGSADERMKSKDPSGAREAARSAADALSKARDSARQAARQAQQEGGALSDEPIRIPGADEYKAPERFREDLLEAAKQKATDGFEEMTKRYYEELAK